MMVLLAVGGVVRMMMVEMTAGVVGLLMMVGR